MPDSFGITLNAILVLALRNMVTILEACQMMFLRQLSHLSLACCTRFADAHAALAG